MKSYHEHTPFLKLQARFVVEKRLAPAIVTYQVKRHNKPFCVSKRILLPSRQDRASMGYKPDKICFSGGGMAEGGGFEPPHHDPESCVLPLDDPSAS